MQIQTINLSDLLAYLAKRKTLELKSAALCKRRKRDSNLHVARAMLCQELAIAIAEYPHAVRQS